MNIRIKLIEFSIALLMVFAIMPKSAGVVNAAADVTPPVIDYTNITIDYPEGKNSATAGDTIYINIPVSDEEGGSGIQYVYFGLDQPQSHRMKYCSAYPYEDYGGILRFEMDIEDT
ncbi:MAG: hypothetical protein J5517_03820, partial [Eubacterium sp.]|nr:hypothetical protein [Eubacterium sp.]